MSAFTHNNRLYHIYSYHRTLIQAENALLNYFASGEVSEADDPTIVKHHKHYLILILY